MFNLKKCSVLFFLVIFLLSSLYSPNMYGETGFTNTATLTVDFNGSHENTQASNDSVILGGGSIIHNHTTPIPIVGSAYDTSGNGGRKLVGLSNGWLVALLSNAPAANNWSCYVSKDNGATWSRLCYSSISSIVTGLSLCSNGTKIFILRSTSSASNNAFYSFDATTVSDTVIPFTSLPDTGQNEFGPGCSIAVDSNGHLHAAWCSKNTTYPNSFNIRYSKSTDGGATWASPTQITTANNTKFYYDQPCIVIRDNKPVIVLHYGTDAYIIRCVYWNGSSWVTNSSEIYYASSSYPQSSPCAVVDGNGHIHVSWNMRDSATGGSTDNIGYSKSTDNGATWSAAQRLTTFNPEDQRHPSITVDNNNKIFIFWTGRNTGGSIYNVKYISYDGSWSAITQVTNNTTNSVWYCQTVENYKNFIIPLVIWQDNQAEAVKFYGKWSEGAYQTSGTYTHNEIDISSAGVANNFIINFTRTTPNDTTCTVDVRIYDGSTWSDWMAKNSGDNIIPIGTNLAGYKVQWRTNLGTIDPLVTPSLDDVTIENQGLVSVTGISLNKTSTNIAVGKTETLIAAINPADATNKNVTWTSSDTGVAIVANDGTVTGIGAGIATITATTEDGGFTADCSVNVRVQTIYTYQYEYDPNGSLIKVIISD